MNESKNAVVILLNFEQVITHFVDFEQVKITVKLLREKPDAYALLFFLPIPFSVIPQSSVDYRQVFRPILYFRPSPSQSDLRLYRLPFEWIDTQFFNLPTHVADIRDTMPRQRSLTHTHVTYRTPCHARGHLRHT